jgi:hypothetical protein
MQEHRRGTFSLAGGVTDVVERLTSTPAESFEITAARYAAMPFAKQSLTNRLKAFLRFNMLLLYPGHDLAAYERREGFAVPEQASFAIDTSSWTREHLAQMEEQRGLRTVSTAASEPTSSPERMLAQRS